jgi:hypothetical protein
MSSWTTSGSGITSPGRRSAGGPGLPSSHSHIHEALLQVRYESEGDERGGPELPSTYGLDRCVLLAKEPETIVCYWELGGNALESAQRGLSDDEFRAARLVLRLLAGAGEERERRDLAPFRPGERASFFSTAPDTTYRVEIGLDVGGRRYVPVVASNLVKTPRRP